MQPFKTSLTELLKIDVPIMSAGMVSFVIIYIHHRPSFTFIFLI